MALRHGIFSLNFAFSDSFSPSLIYPFSFMARVKTERDRLAQLQAIGVTQLSAAQDHAAEVASLSLFLL